MRTSLTGGETLLVEFADGSRHDFQFVVYKLTGSASASSDTLSATAEETSGPDSPDSDDSITDSDDSEHTDPQEQQGN